MTSENFAHDAFHVRTNRELFRPRGKTGNPQHDFFAHYSRLSPLQRLSLERHTVNGAQISRYEPDIEHSTCCVKSSGFANQLQDRAREIISGAALVSALTFCAPALATAAPVRDVVQRFSVDRLEAAEQLLSADTSAPEFPALANALAKLINLHPQTKQTRTVDHSLEVKIAAPEYAARTLGNSEDAAEFIRCLKLIAGQDASALYLQQLASHYYAEAKRRRVPDVLKEMGLLALELSAVTATREQLAFDEADNDEEFQSDAETSAPLSPEESRELWLERAALVLDEAKSDGRSRIYSDELRAQTRLVYHKGAASFDYDEFDAHLSEMSAATDDDEEFGAYLDSFERTCEQFDEGFAVSLHMTDGERKIACGDLDDDVDAESLPECVRYLADELYRLFINGFSLRDRGEQANVEGVNLTATLRDAETRGRVRVPVTVYGIDTWMDAAIDEAFGGRVARTMRHLVTIPCPVKLRRPPVRLTTNILFSKLPISPAKGEPKATASQPIGQLCYRTEQRIVPRSFFHEQTHTAEVCPDMEERRETRAVLEILLQHLKRDYHTRGLHESAVYRELTARLADATDTAQVARLKREAWQYKEARQLSFKLFNAFNTHAIIKQAALEAAPLREMRAHRIAFGEGFTMTHTFTDGARPFIVAQPLLNRIPSLTSKTLADFARELHGLPRQEQERLRRAFSEGNPPLYARVRDGLNAEIARASHGKLRYFRWAFYAGNKPEHPIHTLTRDDQAAAWELLKARSNASATPTLPLVEAGASNVAIAPAS